MGGKKSNRGSPTVVRRRLEDPNLYGPAGCCRYDVDVSCGQLGEGGTDMDLILVVVVVVVVVVVSVARCSLRSHEYPAVDCISSR
jgi:hypothetical protein